METNDLESRALQTLDVYLKHSVWLSEDKRATLTGEEMTQLVEGGAFQWIEAEFAAIGDTIAAYDAQEGLSCRFAVRVGRESVITVCVSVLAPWALVALFQWPTDQPDEKRRFLAVQTSKTHAPEAERVVSLLSAWGFYLASEAQCNRRTGLPVVGGEGAVFTYHELLFEFEGYSEPPWAWR